jgi:cation diffusion facilitator CzcD-associated flavoprotein CzcO
MNEAQLVTFMGTKEQQEFWRLSDDSMKAKLSKKPEIYESLTPKWPPGCRRLTPGPGYLEALVKDNVTFVGIGIEKVLPYGIKDKQNNIHELDVIICATGFDTFDSPVNLSTSTVC